tara:strand:+ start:566 stop:847 length:282 start_codon:yes stop_codon:yes gene_type:complete
MVMMVEQTQPHIGVVEAVVLERRHNLHLQELVVMDHLVYMHTDQVIHKLTLVAVVPVVIPLVSLVVLVEVVEVMLDLLIQLQQLEMVNQELPD